MLHQKPPAVFRLGGFLFSGTAWEYSWNLTMRLKLVFCLFAFGIMGYFYAAHSAQQQADLLLKPYQCVAFPGDLSKDVQKHILKQAREELIDFENQKICRLTGSQYLLTHNSGPDLWDGSYLIDAKALPNKMSQAKALPVIQKIIFDKSNTPWGLVDLHHINHGWGSEGYKLYQLSNLTIKNSWFTPQIKIYSQYGNTPEWTYGQFCKDKYEPKDGYMNHSVMYFKDINQDKVQDIIWDSDYFPCKDRRHQSFYKTVFLATAKGFQKQPKKPISKLELQNAIRAQNPKLKLHDIKLEAY